MYRIGIDLGGTNIAVGLVKVSENGAEKNYELVKKLSTPTLAHRPAEEIMDDMAAVCKKLCKEAEVSLCDVEAIGIATPGLANCATGVVEYANNLPFKNFPLADMLKKRLGFENVSIANDANAAALGEAAAGAAKGTSSSVMITLGTGVGGGIVLDGKLLCGFNFAAGELGHIVIEVDGVPCSCGRNGCWEAYSSATALVRMTNEKIAEKVVDGYKKIENGVVEGYKKIENGVVAGFEKVSDKCVEVLFAKDGESVEDAKKRLSGNARKN
jgi:glucokinase